MSLLYMYLFLAVLVIDLADRWIRRYVLRKKKEFLEGNLKWPVYTNKCPYCNEIYRL